MRITTSNASTLAVRAMASLTCRMRWSVDQHEIARFGKLFEHGPEPRLTREVGAVERMGPLWSTPERRVPRLIVRPRSRSSLPKIGIADERFIQLHGPERHVGDPRDLTPLQAEEAVECRALEVQVHERNLAAGASQRNGGVGNCRRLALSPNGARDHNCPGTPVQVRESQVGRQDAKDLGFRRAGIPQHRQAVLGHEPLRQLGYAAQKRDTQPLVHLLGGPHSRVERVTDEREGYAEDQAKHEAECGVPGVFGWVWTVSPPARMTAVLEPCRASTVRSSWSFLGSSR